MIMAGTAPCDADEVPEAEAAVRDLRTDMFILFMPKMNQKWVSEGT